MEKDIKNVFIEDHDFDLKLVKKYFDSKGENFDISNYKIINGVVLQQITYKEYNASQRKIDAEDIPVNATILISAGYAFTSSNEKYKVRYRVVPNYLTAKAIKERADLYE